MSCHFCHIAVEPMRPPSWPPTLKMLQDAKPAGDTKCYVGDIWDSTDIDWMACCNCAKNEFGSNQMFQQHGLRHVTAWSQSKYNQQGCLNCKDREH
eukprot:CAMPEP_0198225676 /NCGR_PEP_ID=MMETSP1445-20131203/102136_1 /TAXON_ID=36898 /ORGANISM="Pyramimonas sp., Strain CCMP2087" /LENGTH=95 /DNA_ID=CAMNT_0043905271 /DNA_START=154 /DNA_END=441 /DNA_ORIENTATION=+